jgi:hypothetical protein
MPSSRSSHHSFVPSILTPSRAPSNAAIPASRGTLLRENIWALDFPGWWGIGRVFEWYHSQQDMTIKTVQLRKEHDAFQHEYIVIVLNNGSIYRIDRRPDPALPIDTLMRTGCSAIDTLQTVESSNDLDSSHSVLQVDCQKENADFILTLLICFTISKDELAGRYTVQRFNCYFFAWAILLLFSRYLLEPS